jgi:hypothetical protein
VSKRADDESHRFVSNELLRVHRDISTDLRINILDITSCMYGNVVIVRVVGRPLLLIILLNLQVLV